jgi:hypothetical protein
MFDPVSQTSHDSFGCSSTLLLFRSREDLGAQVKHGQRARDLDGLADFDDRKVPDRDLISKILLMMMVQQRMTYQPQHMPTKPKPPATFNNSRT